METFSTLKWILCVGEEGQESRRDGLVKQLCLSLCLCGDIWTWIETRRGWQIPRSCSSRQLWTIWHGYQEGTWFSTNDKYALNHRAVSPFPGLCFEGMFVCNRCSLVNKWQEWQSALRRLASWFENDRRGDFPGETAAGKGERQL